MFKHLFVSTLFVAVAIVCTGASAAERPELSQYLDQQLTSMEAGVLQEAQTSPVVTSESDPDSAYFLRRFWLRIRAKASFGVSGVLGLAVIPEIEVLWERPLPEGWTSFKKTR